MALLERNERDVEKLNRQMEDEREGARSAQAALEEKMASEAAAAKEAVERAERDAMRAADGEKAAKANEAKIRQQ